MLALFFIVNLASEPAPYLALKNKFSKVSSFEAKFEQTIAQELFADPADRATGSLTFTRPRQLSWRYLTPRPREIKFDGQRLFIIEGTEKTEVRELGRITLEKSFAFLWGQVDPNYFRIDSKSPHSFRIKPKQKADTNFEWIDVDVKNGIVSAVRIRDNLGGQSLLKFSDWKFKGAER